MPEVYAKYEEFRVKKALESDPLVRWCPKSSCQAAIKGANMHSTKLTCGECGTEVCFRCREEWHGRWISCEKHMENQFKSWMKDVND